MWPSRFFSPGPGTAPGEACSRKGLPQQAPAREVQFPGMNAFLFHIQEARFIRAWGKPCPYWTLAQHKALTLWIRAGKEPGIDSWKYHISGPRPRGLKARHCAFEEGERAQRRQHTRSASGVRLYVPIRNNARRYSFPETHFHQELEADSVFPWGRVFLTSCQTQWWRPRAHCQWVTSSPRRSTARLEETFPQRDLLRLPGVVCKRVVCVCERARIIL